MQYRRRNSTVEKKQNSRLEGTDFRLAVSDDTTLEHEKPNLPSQIAKMCAMPEGGNSTEETNQHFHLESRGCRLTISTATTLEHGKLNCE